MFVCVCAQEGVVDEGGESEQETGVEEDLDAEAQAGISVDPHGSTMDPHGISVDPHAEPVPEDPEEPAMETGSDVGAETEVPPDASDEGADHQVDQSMDDTYPAPGSESGDTLGMPGEGMGTYVGVGT